MFQKHHMKATFQDQSPCFMFSMNCLLPVFFNVLHVDIYSKLRCGFIEFKHSRLLPSLFWKIKFFILLCACSFFIFFSPFIFISWRLITLQYCSGFCHILIWISHGFTCVPHPDPPSHLPPHPIPLGLPSAPGPSTYLMHPTWAGDLFHYR